MVLQYFFLVNSQGHDSHIHPMGLISYYWVVKSYISPVVRSTLNPRTTKKQDRYYLVIHVGYVLQYTP